MQVLHEGNISELGALSEGVVDAFAQARPPQIEQEAVQLLDGKHASWPPANFRLGVSYENRLPCGVVNFVVRPTVIGSLRQEMAAMLPDTDDEIDIDSFHKGYISAAAWGQMLFEHHIVNPLYPRLPERINALKEALVDRDEIDEALATPLYTGETTASREDNVIAASELTDAQALRINGLRAGITLYRAMSGDDSNGSPVNDYFALTAQEALRIHLGDSLSEYSTETSHVLLEHVNERPAGLVAEVIPEWLIASAVPMSTDRVETLLEV